MGVVDWMRGFPGLAIWAVNVNAPISAHIEDTI